MHRKKPTMLVVIGTSCGAVDWVLPVLWRVRQKGQARICVFFKNERVDRQLRRRYSDLAGMLKAVADEILTVRKLVAARRLGEKLRLVQQNMAVIWRSRTHVLRGLLSFLVQLATLPWLRSVFRAARLVEPLQIQLLRDHLANDHVTHLFIDMEDNPGFCQAFPESRPYFFPHGTMFFSDHRDNTERNQYFAERFPYRLVPKGAVWFAGTSRDEEYYRRLGLSCTIAGCGHPKFDPLWTEIVKSRTVRRSGPKHPQRLTILLLLMPLWKVKRKERVVELTQGVLRTAARYGFRVLVKPHPVQGRREIARLMKGVNRRVYEWCETSVLAGAARSDLAVSFPSSAIMDVIAMGRPAFELFDFRDERFENFVSQNGESTSIYRKHGLVVPLDSADDLEAWLACISQSPDFLDGLRRTQRVALEKLVENPAGTLERVLAWVASPPHRGPRRTGFQPLPPLTSPVGQVSNLSPP
jgi:hypothetical protein